MERPAHGHTELMKSISPCIVIVMMVLVMMIMMIMMMIMTKLAR